MGAKYIVLEDAIENAEEMIILPSTTQHVDVAQAMIDYSDGQKKLVSAGMIYLDENELVCHGESVSLGITPSEQRLQTDKYLANSCIMFGNSMFSRPASN